jgi:hypothetical protein
MSKNATLEAEELARLDRIYREGGLKNMASPTSITTRQPVLTPNAATR